VAAYHLFPHFVGGQNETLRQSGIENGQKLLAFAMQTQADSPFLAGDLSLADLYLAPLAHYVSLTPDAPAVFAVAGFAAWWTRVQALPSYQATQP
jgi:glutathione S-transferase